MQMYSDISFHNKAASKPQSHNQQRPHSHPAPPPHNIMHVFPGEYKYQRTLSICNIYYPRDP